MFLELIVSCEVTRESTNDQNKLNLCVLAVNGMIFWVFLQYI